MQLHIKPKRSWKCQQTDFRAFSIHFLNLKYRKQLIFSRILPWEIHFGPLLQILKPSCSKFEIFSIWTKQYKFKVSRCHNVMIVHVTLLCKFFIILALLFYANFFFFHIIIKSITLTFPLWFLLLKTTVANWSVNWMQKLDVTVYLSC